MANKTKGSVFFCKECGYENVKWLGQCPGCKEWNTFVEEPVLRKGHSGKNSLITSITPSLLSDISLDTEDRTKTGMEELDRVLGGGIVKGSLILVGGDPGIGKSTLLLQVCKNLADIGKKVLYVSGEESLKQIKVRSMRIGKFNDNLFIIL